MRAFALTEDEHAKALKLADTASAAPVMLADGMDLSAVALERLRSYLGYLGMTHGYEPATATISRNSRTFNAEEAT